MGAASIRIPSVRDLGEGLREAAAEAARRIAERGFRSWIVGGAVRDLALGESPKDVDLASAAPPEAIEATFGRAIAVGRAYGTLILPFGGLELQHTTFRTESSYSDARRPDEVRFGSTLEEDARRRDFTCNALYLDPLTDEHADPTGGLDDLRAGVLRCVGDPRERFAEDGLRLLRMARFAAAYELRVEDDLKGAARGAAPALAGVSPERVLNEFERTFARGRAGSAVLLLGETGLLAALFPEVASGEEGILRGRRFGARGVSDDEAPGSALGLALLLGPAPGEDAGASAAALDALRPARDLRRAVRAIWNAAAELERLLAGAGAAPAARWTGAARARAIRLVREASFAPAAAYARALRREAGAATEDLDELERFAAGLAPDDLRPATLVGAGDLAAAGVAPGPLFGELLARAEDAQLAGELRSREEVPEWLRRELGR